MKVEVDLTEYGVKAPKWYDPINPHVINASGGSGGGNDVELTLEEYEALSEEEKMNGTNYFITDIGNPKSLSKKLLCDITSISKTNYTLSDNINNYDFLIVELYATNSTYGTHLRNNLILSPNKAKKFVITGYWDTGWYGSLDISIINTTLTVIDLVQFSTFINPDSHMRVTGYRYERVIVPNQMVNYSTVEARIGTWIDGKPLYQKTVKFNASNASDSVLYNHGISNIDLVVSYDAYLIDDVGNCRKLLELYSDFSSLQNLKIYYAAIYRVNRTNIELMYGSWLKDVGYSTYPCYVTLQYTKTTD